MKLAKYRHPNGSIGVGVIDEFDLVPLDLAGRQYNCLADILESEDPRQVTEFLLDTDKRLSLAKVKLLPPIDQQEVWAVGSTYQCDYQARVPDGATVAECYRQVFEGERPELFFKASAHRIVGPTDAVRIRRDSRRTVPEPEVVLVLNSRLQIVGFTIGNDVSARDIEAENPLYLPQAKVYDACASLGPCVTLRDHMPDVDSITVEMWVMRDEQPVFEGRTTVRQMVRTFDQMVQWLGRENSFPRGAMLFTGSGIAPDREFSLHAGDVVEITVSGVGTLINSVEAG